MNQSILRPKIFMMDLLATVPYYTAYLSKALLAEHVDVTVGSISYYLDPICFSSRGIPIDPGLLNVVGRVHLPRTPRRILKLIEAIINLGALAIRFLASPPDVIHVQYLPMVKWRVPLDLWFLKFCQMRGVKIVLTVHDLLPHDSGEVYRKTFHTVYLLADRMICHSEHIRTRLSAEFSVPAEKVAVIPHGPFFYDLPAEGFKQTSQDLQIRPGMVTILWQGIIFPYKGIDLLLDAWQKVEANCENACLVIVGTGAPEFLDQIREQARQLDLKRVSLDFRFISTDELVALYRAADIVVYPYRAITTSGALATGLAMAKAIVASDLPVFRELLTNRKNALLVDPQAPCDLADALIELIRDAALRGQLNENVRQMNFGDESWYSIARETIEVYERVLPVPS